MADGKEENPEAVKLGRRGGKARLKTMTAEERSEADRKAVQVRWKKEKDSK